MCVAAWSACRSRTPMASSSRYSIAEVVPCAAVKPLLSRSTTGEFNSPPNYLVDAGADIKPLLSHSTTGEFNSPTKYFKMASSSRYSIAEMPLGEN
eukprot:1185072-Prorocentrum_minimum.AAC.2